MQNLIYRGAREGYSVTFINGVLCQFTLVDYMKGRESEWSSPQIEDGELPEMPKNQIKIIHTVKGKV